MERFLVSPMEEVGRGVEIGDEVIDVIHLPLLLVVNVIITANIIKMVSH